MSAVYEPTEQEYHLYNYLYHLCALYYEEPTPHNKAVLMTATSAWRTTPTFKQYVMAHQDDIFDEGVPAGMEQWDWNTLRIESFKNALADVQCPMFKRLHSPSVVGRPRAKDEDPIAVN
jgi:hypothetical protein